MGPPHTLSHAHTLGVTLCSGRGSRPSSSVCIRTVNVHACACAGAGVCAAAATGGLTQDQWTAHLASPAFQSRLWVLVTAMEMGSMDLVPSPHVYALGHHEGMGYVQPLRMVFSLQSRRSLSTPCDLCAPGLCQPSTPAPPVAGLVLEQAQARALVPLVRLVTLLPAPLAPQAVPPRPAGCLCRVKASTVPWGSRWPPH